MAAHDPQDNGAPRSSETVAIVDFSTPSGLTPALVQASGLHQAFTPPPPRQLPSATSPGILTPRRLAFRSVFIAALLGSLAWGIAEVRQLIQAQRQGPRTSHDTAPVVAADPIDAAEEDPELEDATLPGKHAIAFLRTHVKRDGELDGAAIELAESGAISRQAVTVVNLWATWCEPCTAELPGFQSMFALNRRDRAWGPETRFVPILVDDEEHARSAYSDRRSSMPDIHAALIDQKLDQDGVRGALQQIKLLPPEASLPVTLVFDCRRRISWFKVGVLDEAAFNALADEIDKLRAELGHDKCKPRRTSLAKAKPPVVPTEPTVSIPAAVPTAASTRSCNRNGKCEPRLREDCNLCPADCPCKPGERCNPRTPAVCKEAI